MIQYRIFISYSHDDHQWVNDLVAILQKKTWIIPVLDRDFAPGRGFHDQIKRYIAHAHIFMPIITEASSQRGWVHQEIGYAMALNIPVLPVAIGKEPGEMLYGLQAIMLKPENIGNEWENALDKRLAEKEIGSLLKRNEHEMLPLYERAEFQEDRTMMMVQYATAVRQLDRYGMVRQKGALSSFHIPDRPISDPIWELRYQEKYDDLHTCAPKHEKKRPRQFLYKWLLQERLLLQEHAFEEGCRLIIDPTIKLSMYSNEAMISRLDVLQKFIASFPKDKSLEIVLDSNMEKKYNLTIIGDWFVAEAVNAAPKGGYIQTIFTRHAPTIQKYIDDFNREFDALFEEQNQPDSRNYAVNKIRERKKEFEELIAQKKQEIQSA